MTIKELKKMARREIAKWLDGLPDDGDYSEPEAITDRMSGQGAAEDGDYAVTFIFHNKKEAKEDGGDW